MICLHSLAARLILAAVVFVLLPACSSQEEVSDGMDAARWREDLRVLEQVLIDKHVDPFRVVSEESLRKAVDDLDARIPELSDAAVQVEMCRLVASIGDGFTRLDLPREGRNFRRFPLDLYMYGDDLIVRSTSDHLTRALGAKVVAVAGNPIAAVVAAVAPLIARDNDVGLVYETPRYVVVPDILYGLGLIDSSDATTFTFEKSSERFDLEVPALTREEHRDATWVRARDGSRTPLHYRHRDQWFWFEYLDEDHTMYVKLDRSQDQRGVSTIDKFARELFGSFDSNRVDRLVLDVRNNGGGDGGRNQPIITGFEERKGQLEKGKIFVIVGRETYAAGLAAALDMKKRCGANIVGEPPRGAPNRMGDGASLVLRKSNLVVEYASKLEENPRYKDRLRIDVPVTNRFSDYRSGRDRVLETVLKR